MPAAAIPAWALITSAVAPAAAQTITGVIGAKSASRANERASQTQARGLDQQLAFERENEARRREEYDRAEALNRQQWEARQAQLAPYRAAADALLRRRAQELGLPDPPAMTAPVYPAAPPSVSGTAPVPTSSGTLGTLLTPTERGLRRPAPILLANQAAMQPLTPALVPPPVVQPQGATLASLMRRRI